MKNKITLNINNNTRDSLNQNNLSLCVFLASLSPNKGYPLCWNVANMFLNSMQISWDDLFVSYISTSEIKKKSIIYIAQPQDDSHKKNLVSSSTFKISLKQQMIIDENNSISIANNDDDSIAIKNNTVNPFSSGMGVIDDSGNYTGISSFNLYGNSSISINPVNKAFFMMVPNGLIQKNRVVINTTQQGILIDLESAEDNSRTVEYDINKGWRSNNYTWSSIHESNTDLSKILITNNSTT